MKDDTFRYLDLVFENEIESVNEAVSTTDELAVSDKKTESVTGKQATQQGVNRELVSALKQSEFSFSDTDTWEIAHMLEKRPCVKTVDEDGKEIVGTIEYTTANNCVVHFSEPQSGKAYVN